MLRFQRMRASLTITFRWTSDTSSPAADISITVMAITMEAEDTGQNGQLGDTMDMEVGTDTAIDTATEMATGAIMAMDTAIEVIPAMDMATGATMVMDMATETIATAIVDMEAGTAGMGMAIVHEDMVAMVTGDPMADTPIAMGHSPSAIGNTVTRSCRRRQFCPFRR